jgi:hypothetical protein
MSNYNGISDKQWADGAHFFMHLKELAEKRKEAASTRVLSSDARELVTKNKAKGTRLRDKARAELRDQVPTVLLRVRSGGSEKAPAVGGSVKKYKLVKSEAGEPRFAKLPKADSVKKKQAGLEALLGANAPLRALGVFGRGGKASSKLGGLKHP